MFSFNILNFFIVKVFHEHREVFQNIPIEGFKRGNSVKDVRAKLPKISQAVGNVRDVELSVVMFAKFLGILARLRIKTENSILLDRRRD